MLHQSQWTKWLACAGILASLAAVRGQAADLPKIVEQNGRHALLVDGQPFFMFAGQINNSSAWPSQLPEVWRAVETIHANTVEMPVYWEQIEPARGKFDFSVVDTLLKEARRHNVRLVLLWFATWKNGSAHYLPEWMKLEAGVKYPNITGRNGRPVDSPSPHTQAAMELDATAFAAFMGHLKQADPQHTVLMVQVENESGAWGSVRDYSPAAQKIFESPVPAEMLQPKLLKELKKEAPAAAGANWPAVFGDDADEFFQAYWVAHYVGRVAAAGKAAYPLPLYANAALRDPLSNPKAGGYESGGPTDNVIPIWRLAAPALDLVAPDIYLSDSPRQLKVLDLYNRPDNPLMIPEIGEGVEFGRMLFAVMAHGSIGFCTGPLDDNGSGETAQRTAERLAPFSANYALLGPMMRELARWSFEGKLQAAIEHDDHAAQTLDLGSWQANVSFGPGGRAGRGATTNTQPAVGQLLVAQLGENELMCIGSSARLTFRPIGPKAGKEWHYLRVEEVSYENGKFKPLRIWNGDETDNGGPKFGKNPVALHVTLYTR
ncbi:MAG: DUF5597 domain-containing protein [Verrucomicrobiota bacterium]|jgi:hypothetical protein